MSTSFSCRHLVSLCAFVWCTQTSTLSYSQVKSEPPLAVQKKEPAHDTYSKAGSDSISLIIFGRILVKTTTTAKSTAQGNAAPASPSADKSKKKDKFSIKSTDKLKTNNALY